MVHAGDMEVAVFREASLSRSWSRAPLLPLLQPSKRAVVVGSGPAGVMSAIYLANRGWKVRPGPSGCHQDAIGMPRLARWC